VLSAALELDLRHLLDLPARLTEIEEFAPRESERSRDDGRGKLLDAGVVFLHGVVEEPARGRDLVFDVGQLGLPELLLIRREILDIRFQYLDALLEAAIARVDVDASAVMLR